MDHHEQHHQQHAKERELEKKEHRKQQESAGGSMLPFHPAWLVVLGIVATGGALLIWTVLWPLLQP